MSARFDALSALKNLGRTERSLLYRAYSSPERFLVSDGSERERAALRRLMRRGILERVYPHSTLFYRLKK